MTRTKKPIIIIATVLTLAWFGGWAIRAATNSAPAHWVGEGELVASYALQDGGAIIVAYE